MKMSKFLAIVSIVLMGAAFYSCSPSNSGGNETPSTMSGEGTVYYPDASAIKVCVDKNWAGSVEGNSQCAEATKTAEGVWAYSVGEYPSEFAIVAGVTTVAPAASVQAAATAAVKYSNYLSAPAGKNLVSILTTYVKSKMDVDGKTIEAATEAVKADLKLTGDIMGKPADADLPKINLIAQSVELAIGSAFSQIPNFDMAQITGLISVATGSVVVIIVQIEDAAKNNQPAPMPVLPPNLENAIKDANDSADKNKPSTVMPFALQDAKYFKMPNGKFYILGGKANVGGIEKVSTILVLDPTTRKWDRIKSDELIVENQCGNEEMVYGAVGNKIIAHCYDGNRRVYEFDTTAPQNWWVAKDVQTNNSPNTCYTDIINGSRYGYAQNKILKLDFTQGSLTWQTINETNAFDKACNYNIQYTTTAGKVVYGAREGNNPNGNYYTTTDMINFTTTSDKGIIPPGIANFDNMIFAVFDLNDTAYFFSLKNDKYSEYQEFNLDTLEWSEIKTAGGDAPSKEMSGPTIPDTQSPEHRLIDGKIYLFGAYGSASGYFSDKVYEFDPATGNWKRF